MDQIAQMFSSALASMQGTMKGFSVEVALVALIYLHYRRYGGALSNRQSFGPVLPFVGLTTFLVITAVKSSFALSLGLVGALSIVRFRTPVKDPEELAYIFLTIATGIGTAAGQLLLTVTVVPLILLIKTLMRRGQKAGTDTVFLSIDLPGVSDAETAFGAISGVLRENTLRSSYMHYEMRGGVLHVTAQAELGDASAMPRITSQLRSRYPDTGVSFHDENSIPAP
ncbi:MAG: DUF4956 domain-containing protein [Gemmatimonadota bacterium]